MTAHQGPEEDDIAAGSEGEAVAAGIHRERKLHIHLTLFLDQGIHTSCYFTFTL